MPDRAARKNWPALRELFTKTFSEKTRSEWEAVFDGSDACVTPVKSYVELREEGFRQGPAVTLKESPALETEAWEGRSLRPGQGGKAALEEWWGLMEGKQWTDGEGGAVLSNASSKL